MFQSPRKSLSFRLIACTVNLCFIASFLNPVRSYAQTPADLGMPAAGTMVNLTSAYVPVIAKGLRVHSENPILFDMIVDSGNSNLNTQDQQLKSESEKIIKYFLAALTIPDDDQWVNLSPYEKDRIINDQLGLTDMGRDMLAQDYILKQLTASLINPEKSLGKEFWNKVYTKAQQLYGTNDVPVNTFNKVWIVADKANIYVHDNTAFVTSSHLKVMLEEDYLSLAKHEGVGAMHESPVQRKEVHTLGSQIVREIVLPELEKEVNQGKNFANLRQIFHSMVLAAWYKKNLKEALLNQVYSDKAKIKGVDVADPTIKEKIYQEYLKAYKKGVFNFIKEDVINGQATPRKYFSGGLALNAARSINLESAAQATEDIKANPSEHLFRAEFSTPGTNASGGSSAAMNGVREWKGALGKAVMEGQFTETGNESSRWKTDLSKTDGKYALSIYPESKGVYVHSKLPDFDLDTDNESLAFRRMDAIKDLLKREFDGQDLYNYADYPGLITKIKAAGNAVSAAMTTEEKVALGAFLDQHQADLESGHAAEVLIKPDVETAEQREAIIEQFKLRYDVSVAEIPIILTEAQVNDWYEDFKSIKGIAGKPAEEIAADIAAVKGNMVGKPVYILILKEKEQSQIDFEKLSVAKKEIRGFQISGLKSVGSRDSLNRIHVADSIKSVVREIGILRKALVSTQMSASEILSVMNASLKLDSPNNVIDLGEFKVDPQDQTLRKILSFIIPSIRMQDVQIISKDATVKVTVSVKHTFTQQKTIHDYIWRKLAALLDDPSVLNTQEVDLNLPATVNAAMMRSLIQTREPSVGMVQLLTLLRSIHIKFDSGDFEKMIKDMGPRWKLERSLNKKSVVESVLRQRSTSPSRSLDDTIYFVGVDAIVPLTERDIDMLLAAVEDTDTVYTISSSTLNGANLYVIAPASAAMRSRESIVQDITRTIARIRDEEENNALTKSPKPNHTLTFLRESLTRLESELDEIDGDAAMAELKKTTLSLSQDSSLAMFTAERIALARAYGELFSDPRLRDAAEGTNEAKLYKLLVDLRGITTDTNYIDPNHLYWIAFYISAAIILVTISAYLHKSSPVISKASGAGAGIAFVLMIKAIINFRVAEKAEDKTKAIAALSSLVDQLDTGDLKGRVDADLLAKLKEVLKGLFDRTAQAAPATAEIPDVSLWEGEIGADAVHVSETKHINTNQAGNSWRLDLYNINGRFILVPVFVNTRTRVSRTPDFDLGTTDKDIAIARMNAIQAALMEYLKDKNLLNYGPYDFKIVVKMAGNAVNSAAMTGRMPMRNIVVNGNRTTLDDGTMINDVAELSIVSPLGTAFTIWEEGKNGTETPLEALKNWRSKLKLSVTFSQEAVLVDRFEGERTDEIALEKLRANSVASSFMLEKTRGLRSINDAGVKSARIKSEDQVEELIPADGQKRSDALLEWVKEQQDSSLRIGWTTKSAAMSAADFVEVHLMEVVSQWTINEDELKKAQKLAGGIKEVEGSLKELEQNKVKLEIKIKLLIAKLQDAGKKIPKEAKPFAKDIRSLKVVEQVEYKIEDDSIKIKIPEGDVWIALNLKKGTYFLDGDYIEVPPGLKNPKTRPESEEELVKLALLYAGYSSSAKIVRASAAMTTDFSELIQPANQLDESPQMTAIKGLLSRETNPSEFAHSLTRILKIGVTGGSIFNPNTEVTEENDPLRMLNVLPENGTFMTKDGFINREKAEELLSSREFMLLRFFTTFDNLRSGANIPTLYLLYEPNAAMVTKEVNINGRTILISSEQTTEGTKHRISSLNIPGSKLSFRGGTLKEEGDHVNDPAEEILERYISASGSSLRTALEDIKKYTLEAQKKRIAAYRFLIKEILRMNALSGPQSIIFDVKDDLMRREIDQLEGKFISVGRSALELRFHKVPEAKIPMLQFDWNPDKEVNTGRRDIRISEIVGPIIEAWSKEIEAKIVAGSAAMRSVPMNYVSKLGTGAERKGEKRHSLIAMMPEKIRVGQEDWLLDTTSFHKDLPFIVRGVDVIYRSPSGKEQRQVHLTYSGIVDETSSVVYFHVAEMSQVDLLSQHEAIQALADFFAKRIGTILKRTPAVEAILTDSTFADFLKGKEGQLILVSDLPNEYQLKRRNIPASKEAVAFLNNMLRINKLYQSLLPQVNRINESAQGKFTVELLDPRENKGHLLVRFSDRNDDSTNITYMVDKGFRVLSRTVKGQAVLFSPEDIEDVGSGLVTMGPSVNRLQGGKFVRDGEQRDINDVDGLTREGLSDEKNPIHGVMRVSNAWDSIKIGTDGDGIFIEGSFELKKHDPKLAEAHGNGKIVERFTLIGDEIVNKRTTAGEKGAIIDEAKHPFQLYTPGETTLEADVLGQFKIADEKTKMVTGAILPVPENFDFAKRGGALVTSDLDHTFTIRPDSQGNIKVVMKDQKRKITSTMIMNRSSSLDQAPRTKALVHLWGGNKAKYNGVGAFGEDVDVTVNGPNRQEEEGGSVPFQEGEIRTSIMRWKVEVNAAMMNEEVLHIGGAIEALLSAYHHLVNAKIEHEAYSVTPIEMQIELIKGSLARFFKYPTQGDLLRKLDGLDLSNPVSKENYETDWYPLIERLATEAPSAAMNHTEGGIDFNAKNMAMQVSGDKLDIKFDPAMIAQFKRGDFSGIRPVIINITPIASVFPLLGLKEPEESERLAKV